MVGYSESLSIPKGIDAKLTMKLKGEISTIKKELKSSYDTNYASFFLPDDKKNIADIEKFAKTYAEYKTIVVVGIGGSNLGAQAIYEAVCGKYQNMKSVKKLFFADTVDSDSISEIKRIIEHNIKYKQKFVINVVSKSGGTTETIANYSIFEKLIKQSKLSLQDHVVITTNKGSKFWDYAEKNKIPSLAIPTLVGGRYSVFSAVGLFPLAAYGIDIKKLIQGANLAKEDCLKPTLKNPAMKSAKALYYYSTKGYNIAETFIFRNDFEVMGKWYRQLMGESIGKEYNLQKKKVWNGITPTVAIGSTDLHSMAQLYLGGPKDKFVMFLLPKEKVSLKLTKNAQLEKLVPGISSKSFAELMTAIVKGIQGAFQKQKRPFSTITLNNSLTDIAYLLQMKMFEIVFLAKLMSVNPFDQPNVEEYKIITKKFLK